MIMVWIYCIAMQTRKVANAHGKLGPLVAELLQRALKMITQKGLSAKTLPSSSPLALALLVCSVSHVWPIWTFFVN